MAPGDETGVTGNKRVATNQGAWTAEEDRKLSEYIEVHGPKRWRDIAVLNRCGKSCRLQWLNYLQPNIKRGNISNAEEDLILRVHKLLGNRWSLIARRLPGRTDNEIKNYWNSHLSKKISAKEKTREEAPPTPARVAANPSNKRIPELALPEEEQGATGNTIPDLGLDLEQDDLFDFTVEGSCGVDWVNKFLELDQNA
ncbi:hypothetical protein MLD38_019688 [Melastoma candidum]|uniref:Uncharacterized protein n=1 Tax=Melastoma candidum TaxID=119954 RepID=A0ACB9QXW4_9MYRT|nr:hypothetical protein MLD38_019688 [Melastoma candidum]